VLALAPSALALAQAVLEIIPLKHRTAEHVLPILQPLLEPGGALRGQGNQLIVRTSPRNLADLRSVLEAIDTPLRQLLISVRFESDAQASRRAFEARGTVRLGDAAISLSPVPADRTAATIRIDESRASARERVDQRIQVLEGERAFIAARQSQPLRERQVIRTPGGTVVTQSTVLQEASTGFEVVPRLSGGAAILEIAPRRETIGTVTHGTVIAQRAATTLRVALGEWVEIGGAGSAGANERSGILASRESRESQDRRIWLKVEELRH
jgi:hypothetical protein